MSSRRKRRRDRRRPRVGAAAATPSQPASLLREANEVKRIAYSRRQAAEALGVSISTIDRRIVPSLETVKTPWGQRLIPVVALEQFVREHTERARPVRPRSPRRAGRPPALPDPVVERIRIEYRRGQTFGAIARALTRDGIPTAHGGRQWWPSTVRAILERDTSTA